MAGERLSGVYCIRHVPSGARYIGSSNHIANRWRGHLKALSRGNHTAEKLLTLWLRDGAGAFSFEVLELCDPIILRDREQSWIDAMPETMLLNVGRCAKYSSVVPAVAAKIAASLKGQRLSEERKAKISSSHLGKKRGPHSPIHRERIRQKSLLRRHSLETRAKIRVNHWSRSASADAIKADIAAKARGRPALRPCPSPESRAMKSAALKAAWARGAYEKVGQPPPSIGEHE